MAIIDSSGADGPAQLAHVVALNKKLRWACHAI